MTPVLPQVKGVEQARRPEHTKSKVLTRRKRRDLAGVASSTVGRPKQEEM